MYVYLLHAVNEKKMNKRLLKVLALATICVAPMSVSAQEFLPADSLKVIKSKQVFTEAQNRMYFVLGRGVKQDIYTYSGVKLEYFKPVNWRLSPLLSGEILYSDEKKVRLWNPYKEEEGKVLFKTKEKNQIHALSYSPDGTYVLVITKDNQINKCVTDEKVKNKIKYTAQLAGTPSKMQINNQANVALFVEGKNVEVFNLERGVSRRVLNFDQEIIDIDFSENCREFAVLFKDGSMKVVNATDLKEKKSYAPIMGAVNCIYHTQGKYVIVNTGQSFQMLNLLTSKIDYIISVDGEGLLALDLLEDALGKDQLFFVRDSNIGVYPLSGVERYHTMDLKYALDLQMSEWAKIRDGESEDEYRNRVNDDSRAQYALQLEYDLVSQMAGNLINEDGARFGKYVENNQVLAVDFNNIPSIYLNIPSADLNELNSIEDIEFFNTIYGLDDKDEFEVIYTDARNKHTGKVYMYDNRSRETISFAQDDFVPMEVIQLANLEAAKLEAMKQEIMEEAKTQDLLTDHTHITVNTEVEQDVDADGNKILNYNVGYVYQVEEEFSERDDFKAGKYVASESNAAVQMLNVIEKSMKEDFAKYLDDCSKIIINITGSADATPINGKLRYNGEYGDIVNQLATQDGELTSMTVTKVKGITSNEELALVRAIGVGEYLKQGAFNNTTAAPIEYKYNVEVSKEKGSAFRRIKVALKFVDTFKKQLGKE